MDRWGCRWAHVLNGIQDLVHEVEAGSGEEQELTGLRVLFREVGHGQPHHLIDAQLPQELDLSHHPHRANQRLVPHDHLHQGRGKPLSVGVGLTVAFLLQAQLTVHMYNTYTIEYIDYITYTLPCTQDSMLCSYALLDPNRVQKSTFFCSGWPKIPLSSSLFASHTSARLSRPSRCTAPALVILTLASKS